MLPSNLKAPFRLSILIACLAILTSAGGLFLDGLYRDNSFGRAAWPPNDFVTLVAAVPLLVVALVLVRRGSLRGQLVWLAMLDYMLYNYAFYLFAAAFNWFFLLYVALFTSSIFALIFGLVNINVHEISNRFRSRTPVRWISGYMVFIALGLSSIYLAQSIGFIATGQLPPIVDLTGHPTSVIFALDLSLVVSVMVLGALWLWNRRPWGYILAAIALVKGTVYTLVLSVSSVWLANTGFPESMAELPLWLTLTMASLVASFFLLGNMQSAPPGSRTKATGSSPFRQGQFNLRIPLTAQHTLHLTGLAPVWRGPHFQKCTFLFPPILLTRPAGELIR